MDDYGLEARRKPGTCRLPRRTTESRPSAVRLARGPNPVDRGPSCRCRDANMVGV